MKKQKYAAFNPWHTQVAESELQQTENLLHLALVIQTENWFSFSSF